MTIKLNRKNEFAWSPVYIRKDQLQLFLSEDHRQHDILSHKKTVHETKILENKADLIPPDIRKLVSIQPLHILSHEPDCSHLSACRSFPAL